MVSGLHPINKFLNSHSCARAACTALESWLEGFNAVGVLEPVKVFRVYLFTFHLRESHEDFHGVSVFVVSGRGVFLGVFVPGPRAESRTNNALELDIRCLL